MPLFSLHHEDSTLAMSYTFSILHIGPFHINLSSRPSSPIRKQGCCTMTALACQGSLPAACRPHLGETKHHLLPPPAFHPQLISQRQDSARVCGLECQLAFRNMFGQWRAGLKPPRLASQLGRHGVFKRAVSGSHQPLTWRSALHSSLSSANDDARPSRLRSAKEPHRRFTRPPNEVALSSEALQLEKAIENGKIDPVTALRQRIERDDGASIGIVRICLQTYRSLRLIDLSQINRLDRIRRDQIGSLTLKWLWQDENRWASVLRHDIGI